MYPKCASPRRLSSIPSSLTTAKISACAIMRMLVGEKDLKAGDTMARASSSIGGNGAFVAPIVVLGFTMKVSARNVLKGTIAEVVRGQMTAEVRVDVGGTVITSSIASKVVDELGLKPGMSVLAVIKSSDVIIVVD